METPTVISVILAILTGIAPTLLWLWFWLREDWKNPEPRWMLFLAFVAGMIAVVVSFFIESWAADLSSIYSLEFITFAAFIEEVLVLILTGLFVLGSKHVNEPIDYAIYLGTAGLGFAALENVLFLLDPIGSQNFLITLMTSNLRFLGATVLHGLTGILIGITLGHAIKYHSHRSYHLAMGTLYGLILATLLHGAFNLSIIFSTPATRYVTLVALWVIGFLVIYAFHRLKKSSRRWGRI